MNWDPSAVAVLDKMRDLWRRWEGANSAQAQRAVLAEARSLGPAYDAACRVIGLST